MNKGNFPLPSLGIRLSEIRDNIYDGIGAKTIRGLQVGKYTPGDLAVIFLGISSYIAEQRGLQDRDCNMISRLMSCLLPIFSKNSRTYPGHRERRISGRFGEQLLTYPNVQNLRGP